jgi:hypothetical protein
MSKVPLNGGNSRVKLQKRTITISSVVILTIFLFYYRARIVTRLWHWQHGNTVTVGDYQLPVPANWLVHHQVSGLAMLTQTYVADERRGGSLSPPTIIVITLSQPTADLDFWESEERRHLTQSGLGNADSRTIYLAHETVKCIGGNRIKVPGAALYSIECRSTNRLAIMFTGEREDAEIFYELVSRVHRME